MVAKSSCRNRSKRNVGIGVWLEFDWHKLMPRDLTHGRHHSFVKGRLADQATHMKYPGGNFREHMLTRYVAPLSEDIDLK